MDSVTVTVSVKTSKGLDESLTFFKVSHPIEFDDIARRIKERGHKFSATDTFQPTDSNIRTSGYPRPIALAPLRPVYNVTVTSGQSEILARKGAEVNL